MIKCIWVLNFSNEKHMHKVFRIEQDPFNICFNVTVTGYVFSYCVFPSDTCFQENVMCNVMELKEISTWRNTVKVLTNANITLCDSRFIFPIYCSYLFFVHISTPYYY